MEVPRHSPGRDSGNCAAAFSLATGPALGSRRWPRLRFPLDQSPTLLRSQSTCCPFLTGLISICSPFLSFLWKISSGKDKEGKSLSWLMQQNYVVYSSHLSGPFPLLMAFFPEESHGYWFQPAGFDPWVAVRDHRSPLEGMSWSNYLSQKAAAHVLPILDFKCFPACGEISLSILQACVSHSISRPILISCFVLTFHLDFMICSVCYGEQ